MSLFLLLLCWLFPATVLAQNTSELGQSTIAELRNAKVDELDRTAEMWKLKASERQERLQSCQQSLEALTRKSSAQSVELADLMVKLEAKEQILASQSAARKEIEEDLAQARGEIKSLKDRFGELRRKAEEREQHVQEITEEMQDLEAKNKEESVAYKNLEKDLQQARSELRLTESKRKEAETQVREKAQEVEVLEEVGFQLISANTDLENDLQATNQILVATNEALEAEKNKLKRKNYELELKVEELKKQKKTNDRLSSRLLVINGVVSMVMAVALALPLGFFLYYYRGSRRLQEQLQTVLEGLSSTIAKHLGPVEIMAFRELVTQKLLLSMMRRILGLTVRVAMVAGSVGTAVLILVVCLGGPVTNYLTDTAELERLFTGVVWKMLLGLGTPTAAVATLYHAILGRFQQSVETATELGLEEKLKGIPALSRVSQKLWTE